MRKTRSSCLSLIRRTIIKTLVLSCCVVSIWLASSASNQVLAAVIKYSGAFSITDTRGISDFSIGDTYGFMFTLDDSIEDITPMGAFHPGAVSNFSLSLISGTWDPNGGSLGFQSATAFEPTGLVAVSGLVPSGFPRTGIENRAFSSVGLFFNDSTLSNVKEDTGIGQTLAERLTAGFFNPQLFPEKTVRLSFENSNSRFETDVLGEISSITASPVPVPATVFLLAPALLGLLGFKRKKAA